MSPPKPAPNPASRMLAGTTIAAAAIAVFLAGYSFLLLRASDAGQLPSYGPTPESIAGLGWAALVCLAIAFVTGTGWLVARATIHHLSSLLASSETDARRAEVHSRAAAREDRIPD